MTSPSNRILYSSDVIQAAVQSTAEKIADWVEASSIHALGWVTVLEGGKPFSRDLYHEVTRRVPGLAPFLGEVRVTATSGTSLLEERNIVMMNLKTEVLRDIPVLLVDDLVDTGKTLLAVRKNLLQMGAREVKTAVALNKNAANRGTADLAALDLGLTPEHLRLKGLKDLWVYGYGMDWNGLHREDPAIGALEIKKL